MTNTQKNGLFDWEGRIGRLQYFLVILPTAIAGGILLVLIETAASWLLLIPLLAVAYISTLAAIKRLHDLGHSGWFCLLSIIPFINFAFGLYILFATGSTGSNKYGPSPDDKPGVGTQQNHTRSESRKFLPVSTEVAETSSQTLTTNKQVANSPMFKITVDEDRIYTDIAKELENGVADKGLWTRLYSECEGDERKTKVLYIKQRAAKLISAEHFRLEQAAREKNAEAERIEKLRPPPSDAQLMEEYGITFDNKLYTYGEYKYEKLSDAIRYARQKSTAKICKSCRAVNKGDSSSCVRCGNLLST